MKDFALDVLRTFRSLSSSIASVALAMFFIEHTLFAFEYVAVLLALCVAVEAVTRLARRFAR